LLQQAGFFQNRSELVKANGFFRRVDDCFEFSFNAHLAFCRTSGAKAPVSPLWGSNIYATETRPYGRGYKHVAPLALWNGIAKGFGTSTAFKTPGLKPPIYWRLIGTTKVVP
jgi:hypothetical protein